ncbi:MAG: tetratricopeptide repeat protein, partial [Sedimenticola sp.]
IEKALGRQEGMAIIYANLGTIYKTQEKMDRALEAWQISLELFKAIGSEPMREQIQSWIDDSPAKTL